MALVPFSHASPFAEEYHADQPLREFELCGRTLRLRQCRAATVHQQRENELGEKELGFGGTVRQASFVLAELLARQPERVAGRSVVELGAGLGLVSIVAALCGAARVAATDGDAELLETCAANVAANGVEGTVDVRALRWGDDKAAARVGGWGFGGGGGGSVGDGGAGEGEGGGGVGGARGFDVVLAADVVCVVYEAAFEALLLSLRQLATPASLILLSYRRRHGSEARFFELLDESFECEALPRAALHADFGAEDHPITVFQLRLRHREGAEGD